MKELKPYVIILLIIGGLNWGLVGLFDFNLVTAVFGSIPVLEKVVYILVGVAAIFKAYWMMTMKKK